MHNKFKNYTLWCLCKALGLAKQNCSCKKPNLTLVTCVINTLNIHTWQVWFSTSFSIKILLSVQILDLPKAEAMQRQLLEFPGKHNMLKSKPLQSGKQDHLQPSHVILLLLKEKRKKPTKKLSNFKETYICCITSREVDQKNCFILKPICITDYLKRIIQG